MLAGGKQQQTIESSLMTSQHLSVQRNHEQRHPDLRLDGENFPSYNTEYTTRLPPPSIRTRENQASALDNLATWPQRHTPYVCRLQNINFFQHIGGLSPKICGLFLSMFEIVLLKQFVVVVVVTLIAYLVVSRDAMESRAPQSCY